jgi:hypothetical protein
MAETDSEMADSEFTGTIGFVQSSAELALMELFEILRTSTFADAQRRLISIARALDASCIKNMTEVELDEINVYLSNWTPGAGRFQVEDEKMWERYRRAQDRESHYGMI